jgi:hypothetical protein
MRLWPLTWIRVQVVMSTPTPSNARLFLCINNISNYMNHMNIKPFTRLLIGTSALAMVLTFGVRFECNVNMVHNII